MATRETLWVPRMRGVLGDTCKSFRYWKSCMVSYLNLVGLRDIVDKGYDLKYDPATDALTDESKVHQKENAMAVNVILNSVHESVGVMFADTDNAHEMWEALLNRYERNTQSKLIKKQYLETKFENFCIKDGECVEDMYTRLLQICNEYYEIGESVTNDRIVEKLFQIMAKRSRWKDLLGSLYAIHVAVGNLTPEAVYTHLLYFEERNANKLVRGGRSN